MNKSIIALFCAFLYLNSLACDVCGGVNTNGLSGFAPSNDFHFIGFRSTFRHYCSHTSSMLTGVKTSSEEYFVLSEITGKIQFSTKWQLNIFVPYAVAVQSENSLQTMKKGFGDISINSFYTPYIQKDSMGGIRGQFNVGFGIKLPTGIYASSAHEMSNMYPGTGAFDALFSINYLLQRKKQGVQIEVSDALHGKNKYGYQYGNSFTTGINYFRMFKTGISVFRPFVGIQLMNYSKDRIDGITASESANNGAVLGAKIGLNYIRSNWFVSLYGQVPIYQNLGNGAVQQKQLCQFSINYLISKKSKK